MNSTTSFTPPSSHLPSYYFAAASSDLFTPPCVILCPDTVLPGVKPRDPGSRLAGSSYGTGSRFAVCLFTPKFASLYLQAACLNNMFVVVHP